MENGQSVQLRCVTISDLLASVNCSNSGVSGTLQTVLEELKEIKDLVKQQGPAYKKQQPASQTVSFSSINECESLRNLVTLHFLIIHSLTNHCSSFFFIHSSASESQQLQNTINTTNSLRKDIADTFALNFSKKPSIKFIQKMRKEYRIPSNCGFLESSQVQPKLWIQLPNEAKELDLQFQKMQSYISLTTVSLGRMAEGISDAGRSQNFSLEMIPKLLEMILHCATMIGWTNQIVMEQREVQVRKLLGKTDKGASVGTELDGIPKGSQEECPEGQGKHNLTGE